MADTKITALTAITTVDPAVDVFPIVDVSDTTMAASGTTKKITSNQLLGAGGTATLASATITGDLTVDTSTLKVDSANDRVGVLTATPNAPFEVKAAGAQQRWDAGSNTDARVELYSNSLRQGVIGWQTNSVDFAGDSSRTTVMTWSNVGGVFGTAMTLNSTGLGVGASPSYKLDISGGMGRISSGSSTCDLFLVDTGTTSGYVRLRSESNAMKFITGNGISAMIDSSGNVGVGVTPSAWSVGFTALQVKNGSISALTNGTYVSANYVYNSGGKYIATGRASQYEQSSGGHYWLTDPTGGSAGGAITFTQAMTLDASGRLGLNGITSPTAPFHLGETSGTAIRIQRITSGNTMDVAFYNTNTTAGDVARIRCDGDGLANTYGALSFWTTDTPGSLVERLRIDRNGNTIISAPSTPPTLATNGQLTVNATSNTNLQFSYRGSDGVTRVANLTLA